MYVSVQFSIYPLKLFFFGQALCRSIQYTQFTSPQCVCVFLPAIFLGGNPVKIKYDIVGVYDIIINGCHMRAVAFHLAYCLGIYCV